GKESEDLGGFVEVINSSCFKKTIKERNIRALWAHNTQYVLGTTASETLAFDDRDDGLHFDIVVPNTSWAGDVYETISRRDAPGVSFGFEIISDKVTNRGKDQPVLRELLEVRLYEVSVGVAFPAYPDSNSETSLRAIFAGNNIDLDSVSEVLKRTSGKVIESADAETVLKAAEALRSMVQSNEPPKGTPTEPKSDFTLEAREREILLLELENNLR
ncbi:MAG: HK97 family phage prohead protease, partial [Fibrobacter sp.]|nr:HK97 family phage prohead protease [Fibrobacter sp.]